MIAAVSLPSPRQPFRSWQNIQQNSRFKKAHDVCLDIDRLIYRFSIYMKLCHRSFRVFIEKTIKMGPETVPTAPLLRIDRRSQQESRASVPEPEP